MFIFGIIIIFMQLSSLEAGGTCVIKFVRYSNLDYKDDAGQCCETTTSSGCNPNECDPFINICIGDISKPRDCNHGKTQTGVYSNTDLILFQDKVGTLSNPVTFRFERWLNGLSFTIRVMDKDSFFSDDLIEDFMYQLTNIIPTPNGTETLLPHKVRGKRVVMDIQYSVYCDINYYGDCTRYCVPNLQYYCDSVLGSKICYQGWSGADCKINIDECQSNPCLNGGQCLDGINNYTCNCSKEYTGQNCEFKNDTSITVKENRYNQTVHNDSSRMALHNETTTESASLNIQESSTILIQTENYEINTKFETEEPIVRATKESSTEVMYHTSSFKNSEETIIDTTTPFGSSNGNNYETTFILDTEEPIIRATKESSTEVMYYTSFKNSEETNIDTTSLFGSSTGNTFEKETEYGVQISGGKTSRSTRFLEDLSTTGYNSTDEVTEGYISHNQDLLSSTNFVRDPYETDSPPSTSTEVQTITESKASFLSSNTNIVSQEQTSTNKIIDKMTSSRYQTTNNVFSMYSSHNYFTDDKSEPNVDTTTSLATQVNNSSNITIWKTTTSGYNKKESQSATDMTHSNKGNALSQSVYNTKPHTSELTKSEGRFVTITTKRQSVDTKTPSVTKNHRSTGLWFSSFSDYYPNKQTSTNSNMKLPPRTGELSSTVDSIASIPLLDTTAGTTDVQTTEIKCYYNIIRNKSDVDLRVFNLKQQQKKYVIYKMAFAILTTKNIKLKYENIKIIIYSTRSVKIMFLNMASAIDRETLAKLGETLCNTKRTNDGKLQMTSGDASGSIAGAVVGLLYFLTLIIIAFILVRRKYRERNKVEDSCSDLETVVEKTINENSDKTRSNTKHSLLTTRAIEIITAPHVDKVENQMADIC